MIFNFFLEDEQASINFAKDFALCLKTGDLVTFEGDLGAGKSTLARAIIKILAEDEHLDVPSPTFTLVQIYETKRFPLAHADLYRITLEEELEELGLESTREDGIILIEWPEIAKEYLKNRQFSLTLSHQDQGRKLQITTSEEAGKRLERTLSIRQFLKDNKRGDYLRFYFTGDASARSYELLKKGKKIEVLMNAPEMEMPDKKQDAGQEKGQVRSYAEKAHLAKDIKQFVGIARLISEHGFLAPKILAQDYENGLLICQDLGRDGIVNKDHKPIIKRYQKAAELLAEFHQINWPEQKIFADFTLNIPHYDRHVLLEEVKLLCEWYLPYIGKGDFSAAQSKKFYALWQELFIDFEQSEQSLVMRDYHSPNILWQKKQTGKQQIGLIDFQDGQIGASAYDVVSLAQDARMKIPHKDEQKIVKSYCDLRHKLGRDFNQENFYKIYAIAGAQRISKIMGIFVRLKLRDNKPDYLQYLPQAKDTLKRNLAHPALAKLQQFYDENGVIDEN